MVNEAEASIFLGNQSFIYNNDNISCSISDVSLTASQETNTHPNNYLFSIDDDDDSCNIENTQSLLHVVPTGSNKTFSRQECSQKTLETKHDDDEKYLRTTRAAKTSREIINTVIIIFLTLNETLLN